jgi:hypothetical protein
MCPQTVLNIMEGLHQALRGDVPPHIIARYRKHMARWGLLAKDHAPCELCIEDEEL